MTATDGRRLRTDRSRERVLTAVLELVEQTGVVPTAQQIADYSEMSIRSVFRLYDDLEALHVAAIHNRTAALRGRYVMPDLGESLDHRIEAFTAIRATVHEDISPLRRIVLPYLDVSEPLRDQFALGMTFLRKQVEDVFAAELGSFSDRERLLRLHALDLTLSWEYWERLRTVQQLAETDARAVIRMTLSQLLSD